MKKILNTISKVILALAVVAFAISIVIPGITEENLDSAFWTLMYANIAIILCAIIGSVLISSKNDTARRVGHGMTVAAFVAGFSIALLFVGKEGNVSGYATTTTAKTDSTAAILMIVAASLLAVYYIFQFVILILNKGTTEAESPLEDSRIARVKEWKQILDEGIITQEEFEEKRNQILGIKPKQDK